MVWLVLILIGLVCVSLIAVRHWQFRHSEEGTISGSLWQLAICFAVGAVPTYLLGVLCASLRGYDAWRWIGAILGGFLAGLGVMAFIAAPLFDLAMGVSRRRAFTSFRPGFSLVAIAIGLLMATAPMWWSNPVGQFATPKLRHSLVHELKNPDESIRLQSADLLADFGTAEEIPALETALKTAQQSGDRELEQKCSRALERIRRR